MKNKKEILGLPKIVFYAVVVLLVCIVLLTIISQPLIDIVWKILNNLAE